MDKETNDLLPYMTDIALGIATGMGFVKTMDNISNIDGLVFGFSTLIPFTVLVIRMSKKVLKNNKETNIKR